MQVKYGGNSYKLRVYAFPVKGHQAEDYHLFLGKDKLGTDRVRTTTGGGKSFTYIKTEEQAKADKSNQSYWLDGIIPSGTKIELIQEGNGAPAPAPEPAAAPVKTAKTAKTKQPAAAAPAPKLEPEIAAKAIAKQRSSKKPAK